MIANVRERSRHTILCLNCVTMLSVMLLQPFPHNFRHCEATISVEGGWPIRPCVRVHAQDITKPANGQCPHFFNYLLHFLCECLLLAVSLGLIYIYRFLLSDIICAIEFSNATESILMLWLFIDKFEYFFAPCLMRRLYYGLYTLSAVNIIGGKTTSNIKTWFSCLAVLTSIA